jgi:hypothetical protein
VLRLAEAGKAFREKAGGGVVGVADDGDSDSDDDECDCSSPLRVSALALGI